MRLTISPQVRYTCICQYSTNEIHFHWIHISLAISVIAPTEFVFKSIGIFYYMFLYLLEFFPGGYVGDMFLYVQEYFGGMWVRK